jgi:hypothetical protein
LLIEAIHWSADASARRRYSLKEALVANEQPAAPLSNRGYKILASLLLVLGVTQMAADLIGAPSIKALASATMLSPCPKVFTVHKGLETYSSRFFVEYQDVDGKAHSVEITAVLYGKVKGPYNRRNVYGAILSYGPVLVSDPIARPMFEAAVHYAIGGDGPLLRELGIDPKTINGPVRVRYVPYPCADMGSWPRVLEVQR